MPTAEPDEAARAPDVPFAEAVRTWLRVGLLSFGGPAGQVALMHRTLVEEKRWVGEARFLHALNFCMLLPGPEAQQLATYVGWLLHGWRGGIVAGTLFVAPGFVVLLVLSYLYARFGEVDAVAAAFFGLKAAVVAIVAEAVVRIGRRALGSRALLAVAALAFVAIFFFGVPFPFIVAAAALGGLALGKLSPSAFPKPASSATEGEEPLLSDAAARSGQPSLRRSALVAAGWVVAWLGPVALLFVLLGPGHVLVEEAVLFSKAAVVTFGGAYAVLAYVSQQAVEVFAWLSPSEMLDGLGLAETTPGPLILVLEFVGFQAAWRDPGALPPALAGVLGAVVTCWVTFVPSFLFIFALAPHVEALRGRRAVAHALSAITAAVVGVVLNLALWFGLHVAFGSLRELRAGPLRLLLPDWASIDLAALAITAAAAVALLRFRVAVPWVLAGAALAGLLVRLAG